MPCDARFCSCAARAPTHPRRSAARFVFDIQPGTGTCGHDTSRQFGERERYNSDKCYKVIVETVCAGDTVLVDLNYLPKLPSRSVDGVATVCFFSVLGPRSEHTSCVPVN